MDADTVTLSSSISISFKKERRVIFWGVPLGSDMTGGNAFDANGCRVIDDGQKIECAKDNGECGFSRVSIDVNQTSAKTIVQINNIPRDQAAFEFWGPGLVVFRDIKLFSTCDNADGCGSIIRLHDMARVVFINAEISADGKTKSVVDVTSGGANFYNHIAFTYGDVTGLTTIAASSENVFAFAIAPLIWTGDFSNDKVLFSHLGAVENWGTESAVNHFWGGDQKFIAVAGQDPVECKFESDFRFCKIVDNDALKIARQKEEWRFSCYDNPGFCDRPQHVTFLEKNDNDDGVKKVEGWNFSEEGEGYYILSVPDGFDPNKVYAMTHYGQPIKFVLPDCPSGGKAKLREDGSLGCDAPVNGFFDCPSGVESCVPRCNDPAAEYRSDINQCVCKDGTNTEMVNGQCMPKSGYEWKDGDPKSGEAYLECKGDAVPAYDATDHNKDQVDRCTCGGGGGGGGGGGRFSPIFRKTLTWSPGGISTCKFFMPSFPIIDNSSPPDDGDESSQDTPDQNSDDNAEDTPQPQPSAEERCLASGGTWIGLTCDYPEKPADVDNSNDDVNAEANDAGSYSGCSLVTKSGPPTSIVWMLFMALPLSLIMWRRRSH